MTIKMACKWKFLQLKYYNWQNIVSQVLNLTSTSYKYMLIQAYVDIQWSKNEKLIILFTVHM